MDSAVFEKVIEIAAPFVKNKDVLKDANDKTSFLKDLQISSSRLVDIVLAIEDAFAIEVNDDEADKISTVGAAVELIEAKKAAR